MEKSTAIAAAIAAAIAMGASAGVTADAEAAGFEAAEPSVSLPYVEDVNPSGNGYVAVVRCAGSPSARLSVKSGGKRVKARKVGTRRWVVKLKRGKLYKVSVRAAGGKWKSIGYRVY